MGAFGLKVWIFLSFYVGVDFMPLDLQRFVSRLREVELEKKGKPLAERENVIALIAMSSMALL